MRLRDYVIDGSIWLLLGLACGVLSAGEAVPIFPVTADQQSAVQAPNEKPYFIMFSGTYCGPCQRWKATEKAKLNAAGYQVTIVNIDEDDRWNAKYNVTTVPRFFLLDRKTRKTLRGPWVGFTPAVTLIMGANGKNLLAPADHSRKVTRITCEEIRAMVRQRYQPGQSLNADVSPQSLVWVHLTDGSGGTHTSVAIRCRACLSGKLWHCMTIHTGRER